MTEFLIPETGRPQDLCLDHITDLQKAKIAEAWLEDMLENLRLQAEFGDENATDPKWKNNLFGAITKTTTKLALVREMKAGFEMTWKDAFFAAAQKIFDPEDLEDVEAEAKRMI